MTEYGSTPDCPHLFRETRLAYITPDAEPKITYKNEGGIPKFETYKMDLGARIIAVFESLHIIGHDKAKKEVELILREENLSLDRAKKLAGRVGFVIKRIFEMPEHESLN